jgi:hypothetical protein
MSIHQTHTQIWSGPIIIGVVSAIGLISALLGDGIWDAVSWVSLSAPMAITAWHVIRSYPT